MGFFTDVLLSLFMGKKARANFKAYVKTKAALPKPGAGTGLGATTREQQIKAMQEGNKDLVTEDRAELIRRAMEIRRAKQQIFADLSDEQRQKLVAIAIKKLLHEKDGEK